MPASPAPEPVVLVRERGRLQLRLTCVAMGQDLAISLQGGDRPHLGAVALARPGEGPEEAPVLTLPGHREDQLARTLAVRLSAQTGAAVCVACGIHLDRIRPEELRDVAELSEDLAGELAARLTAS